MHGLADANVPFAGEPVRRKEAGGSTCLPWMLSVSGCGQTAWTPIPSSNSCRRGRHPIFVVPPWRCRTEVVLYAIAVGSPLPGGIVTASLPKGDPLSGFNATAIIWDFSHGIPGERCAARLTRRPGRRYLVQGGGVRRIEESVLIGAPREVAWRMFTDLTCWPTGTACSPGSGRHRMPLWPGRRLFVPSSAVRFRHPLRGPRRTRGGALAAALGRRALGVRGRHWFLFTDQQAGTRCDSVEDLSGRRLRSPGRSSDVALPRADATVPPRPQVRGGTPRAGS